MASFRRNLLLSGVAGLLACAGITGLVVGLLAAGVVRPPLPYPLATAVLVTILAGFSVAEIPLMVYMLRRLALDRSTSHLLLQILHALYVSFAGVYAAPISLLTGEITWNLLLSFLAVPRLVASLLFVPEPSA